MLATHSILGGTAFQRKNKNLKNLNNTMIKLWVSGNFDVVRYFLCFWRLRTAPGYF